MQHLCSHSVVAKVGAKTQLLIGLDGVESLFLEFVGVDFCGKTDASTFLAQVEKNPAFFVDMLEGGVELASAVAST